VSAEKISPILESPIEWNYRSRVQFKCYGAEDGQFLIGFYAPGSHYVIDVSSCAIAAPAFNALLPLVRGRLHGSPFIKEIPQIDMETDDQNHLRLIFHYTGENSDGLAARLSGLPAAEPLSIFIQSGRKSSLRLVSGSPRLTIEVDAPPIHLAYAAGGFAQVNLAQNRRLVTEALRMSQPEAGWRVLDLYCGMGNFSLPFARRVDHVVGIEDFGASIEQGKMNAYHNQITNVEFHARNACGSCQEFAGESGFDLVLLDPPRTGAKDVILELVRQGVKRILYVSCDPMTLARDMTLLFHNHYTLIESRPVDMFPQTWHLESLSLFVRE
jgi:23S rRNA (uracil1939-C5)-methyltransferase